MSGPTSSSTTSSNGSPLDAGIPFSRRHIGPSADEQAKMLAVLGYSTLDDLVDTAVPKTVHSDSPLALDAGRAEHEVIAELLDRVDDSLVGLVADGGEALAGLRRAVDLLADAMASHLSYEERELVEPLARLGFGAPGM